MQPENLKYSPSFSFQKKSADSIQSCSIFFVIPGKLHVCTEPVSLSMTLELLNLTSSQVKKKKRREGQFENHHLQLGISKLLSSIIQHLQPLAIEKVSFNGTTFKLGEGKNNGFFFYSNFILGRTVSIRLLALSMYWTLPLNQTLVVWTKSELWLIFVGHMKSSLTDCDSCHEQIRLCSSVQGGETKIFEITLSEHLHIGSMKVKHDLSCWKLPRLRHIGNASVCIKGTVDIMINFLLKIEKDEKRPE